MWLRAGVPLSDRGATHSCPTPTRYSESRQQQLRETELVPVRVADVKEALAPGGIHRFVGLEPGRSERLVVCIDLGNTEDYPPLPLSLIGGDGRQIHAGFAEPKAAERSVLAAAQHREPQLPVESDGASQVPNRERYSADVLDFRHRIRIVIATRASQSSYAGCSSVGTVNLTSPGQNEAS